jgi:Arc/MetJ-type ribon-helix-helix transcriptional regulator
MQGTPETTIRVPVTLRERLRDHVRERGLKNADVIALALRELEQAEFLRAVAAVEWDAAAGAEADEWDEADRGKVAPDPWEAAR